MKKFLSIMTMAILLIITYSVPTIILADEGDSASVRVSYYTRGNPTGTSRLMYDDIYMTTCTYDEIKSVERTLANIISVSYTVEGDYDKFREYLLQYNVVVLRTEVVDNIHIIYGRTELCGQPRIVDGMAVNIQIAIDDNIITVGTPLIMGSY